jgi:hypothetical protein
MTEVRTQPELDALEAVRLAIEEARDKVHSLFGGYDYSSYGRTPPLVVRDERKRESRIIWEGDDREESERQYRKATGDYIAQAAISAYLSALSAQGMRVIQESELKSAEGALFNAEQHFKMFADEITGDYPARAADDASRPHRLGLCAKLAGEAWRDLYALIYGEQYQEAVYCGPDPAENTDQVRIGKNDPSTESDRAEPSNPSNLAAGGEP